LKGGKGDFETLLIAFVGKAKKVQHLFLKLLKLFLKKVFKFPVAQASLPVLQRGHGQGCPCHQKV